MKVKGRKRRKGRGAQRRMEETIKKGHKVGKKGDETEEGRTQRKRVGTQGRKEARKGGEEKEGRTKGTKEGRKDMSKEGRKDRLGDLMSCRMTLCQKVQLI